MIIDKWIKRYIERKKERKIDKIRNVNWARLYQKLHGFPPLCNYCSHLADCLNKYKGRKNLPTINSVPSCKEFKKDDKHIFNGRGVSGWTGVSGWSGISGYLGISGVAGVSSYNSSGQKIGTWLPPWNRGSQSCNRKCNFCAYHNGASCTKP